MLIFTENYSVISTSPDGQDVEHEGHWIHLHPGLDSDLLGPPWLDSDLPEASRGKGFSRPGLSWGWILASLGRRGQDYGVMEPHGVVSHVRINPRGPFSSENTGPVDLLFLR